MRTIKRIQVLFLLTLTGFIYLKPVQATHIIGGEITYTWITGNDYAVSLTLYRDCSGIAFPDSSDMAVYSSSCQDSFWVKLPLINTAPLSTSCNGLASTCSGGTYFGYERGVYRDTVSLPVTCIDWEFVYANCCRNGSITNLANAGAAGFLYRTRLNNLNHPHNNSPVFSADPVVLLTAGVTHQINNGIYDPDGDSLVISLAPARDGNPNTPSQQILLAYSPPLSFSNPVNSTPPLSIDPLTGTITVTPQLLEVDVVVYHVDEYRNGVLIGSATRDIQIAVTAGSNQLPVLSGINGTTGFITQVCYSDSLKFSIASADTNPGDSTSVFWHSFSGSDATGSNYSFSNSGTYPDSATFTFYPDSTQISPQPYTLFVSVKDGACPYNGIQTYCYLIYVNSCSQDVWPGDANSDLQVTMLDLLSIGLAYNDTGAVRNGANLLWIGQACPNWTNSFASGVNHKHADCNGDGIVNLADTSGISLNYGLSHPPKFTPPVPGNATVADLYLIASPDTAYPNNTVNISICLGTTAVPVDSIYGISFRINFNPSLVDSLSGTFNFSNSWMGTAGTDLITFTKTFMSAGYADVAMVRNDHNNTNGDSMIAVFSIVVVDNIAGKFGLPITLSDVTAITHTESLLNLSVTGDTVIVDILSATDEPNVTESELILYPVPAGPFLDIDPGKSMVEKVILHDATGRTILQVEKFNTGINRLNLEGIAKGNYLITIHTSSGVLTRRISLTGK